MGGMTHWADLGLGENCVLCKIFANGTVVIYLTIAKKTESVEIVCIIVVGSLVIQLKNLVVNSSTQS